MEKLNATYVTIQEIFTFLQPQLLQNMEDVISNQCSCCSNKDLLQKYQEMIQKVKKTTSLPLLIKYFTKISLDTQWTKEDFLIFVISIFMGEFVLYSKDDIKKEDFNNFMRIRQEYFNLLDILPTTHA